jgi:hypothetical protein
MNRRTFCRAAGLLFSGAWLARCGFAAHNVSSEPYPAVADIEKSIADNRSALRHISTHVNGLRMHALAPANREYPPRPRSVLLRLRLSPLTRIMDGRKRRQDCDGEISRRAIGPHSGHCFL